MEEKQSNCDIKFNILQSIIKLCCDSKLLSISNVNLYVNHVFHNVVKQKGTYCPLDGIRHKQTYI